MTKAEKAAVATEARESLFQYYGIAPGRRIYALEQKSCGASGIVILFVIDGDRILQLSPRHIAALTGYPVAEGDSHMGNRLRSGGMDRKAELILALGAALWPEGTPEPHGMRNGLPDSDGEFALHMERL
jgi:hypothetical protein